MAANILYGLDCNTFLGGNLDGFTHRCASSLELEGGHKNFC